MFLKICYQIQNLKPLFRRDSQMKKEYFVMITFLFGLFTMLVCSPGPSIAQDYTQWGLPEGAKARLSKGGISGNIVYSPDGARLAVASSVGTWLYDAETYQPLSLLTGHTDNVSGVAFSPDGLLLATGSWDQTVRLWDAVTGEHKQTFEGHWDGVLSVAFSPDGKTLVSGSNDATIRFWDVLTSAHKQTLEGHTDRINSVVFSPDGKTLVSGSEDHTVRLWDAMTGAHKQTLTGHVDYILSVSFSPDGNTIASGSLDSTVRLWDAMTGAHKQTLTGHTDGVLSVAFSPDGNTIASGSEDHTIHLWDAMTGAHKQTLTGHADGVRSITFSPDGLTFVSGSGDGTVRFWDAITGEHKQTLTGHTFNGYCVAFSPDGNTIATGNWDGIIRLWDAATSQHKQTLTGHTNWVQSISFSPDGRTIASASYGTIHLWDAMTGAHKQTLTEHAGGVVVFSPDGNTIATGHWDSTIRLWDAMTGEHKQTLTGHTDGVLSISFSPDGKTIASGNWDNTIRLWDAMTGEHKQTLTGHTRGVESVSFSPDGQTLASGSRDDTVRLWDAMTGEHKQTLTGHRSVFSVAFSPDGQILASGGGLDSTIRFWDAMTGEHIQTLTGHGGWVYGLAFSPDGQTLASGDGADVLLWDVTPYLDITPPELTVTILTSSTGQTYDHSQPTISGEFSGAVAPVSLSLTLNGVAVQAEVSGNEFTYTPADALGNGEYTLVVVVTDANGRTAETSVTFTVEVPPNEPDPLLTLQSDTFDGSGQNLQPFWQVQNGDKSYWELKDGQLVVDAGFNQNLWTDDTSTRFYQVTDHDQFTVETSMLVDYADVCAVAGLVVTSPTTESSYGPGEWVMLKFWGRHGSSVLQYQNRGAGIDIPDYNPVQGPTRIAMRLERNGDDYTAWYKPDAEGEWIYVGKTTIALQEPLQVGLFTGICQYEAPGYLTTAFDYFRLTSDATTPGKEEIPYVDATVRFYPSPSESPRVGEQLMLNLNVVGGENITGYQATIQFDETALRYVSSANADFLPADSYIAQPIIIENSVTVAATSLVGETNGDGTLATLTLDVVGKETSTVTLTEVLFSDSEGMLTRPHLESAELIITPKSAYPAWDVNEDGEVDLLDLAVVAQNFGKSVSANPHADVNGDNTIDIFDLALVAQHFGESTHATAPIHAARLGELDPARIKEWITLAQIENDGSLAFQQGIANLERLLASLIPQKTALLANYPNPFNPETWIPYQLAKPAHVSISIYAADGQLIRLLDLGHQPVGLYQSRNLAAHWDGKNNLGESVANGVYFYTLTAGDFTATRKMLILK